MSGVFVHVAVTHGMNPYANTCFQLPEDQRDYLFKVYHKTNHDA